MAGDYEKLRSGWYRKPTKKLFTGKNVKVAVLDTGCNVSYIPVDYPYNFLNNTTNISDNQGHGTSVAAIIKSSIGLAPDCELHFLKICDNTNAIDKQALLDALNYCLSNNIDIVNMSWAYNDSDVNNLLATLISNDIVLVASAGNSSLATTVNTPASLNGVIAVSAIKEDGTNPYFSYLAPEDGHGITICCSGFQCESINSSGQTVLVSGSSFSAPFFTGMFACYKEEIKEASNIEIANYIISKAKKINSPYFGNGLCCF